MIADVPSRQYHNNNLRILYGGFPTTWTAGRMERPVMLKIGEYYANKYPDKQIHVVAPYWDGAEFITEYVSQWPVDILVVCSLVDPMWWESISSIVPIEEAGYTLKGYPLDFFAVVCNERFQKYDDRDLLPTEFKYLFLSYNRKPHDHRKELVQELEKHQLNQVGLITLGHSQYTLKEAGEDYFSSGSTDVHGFAEFDGIPHDAYSLGRLDIWQQSFITVVSETVQPTWRGVFVSEKTFKPIIGLRPFIINGGGEIYPWLKKAGFDCFEDIFPVNEIIAEPHLTPTLIATTLTKYKNADWHKMYNELLPRLQYNKARFFEYAKSELNKL